MNEDQLNRSLEDLFSGVSLPEPEGSGDVAVQRQRVDRVGPEESRSAHESPASRLLGPAPPTEPEGSTPADGMPQPEAPEREKGTPAPPMAPLRFAAWRQRLLQVSLYVASIVGLLVAGLEGYGAYAGRRAVLLPLYLALYLLLLLVTFWEAIPYRARATSFLGFIYGLGVLDLVHAGSNGSGQIFLIALPVVATVFLGKLGGITTLLLSFAAHALSGWVISTDQFLPLEQRATSLGRSLWWWMSALIFLLTGSGLVMLQNHLIPALAETSERGLELTAALANHRARAETHRKELKRRARHLDLVVELGRIAASRLDIDTVLHRAVELLPDYLNCYMAGIFLLDESGEAVRLRAATGLVGAELEAKGLRMEVAETSIVGWTAKHRRPYVAPDVSHDPLYSPYPGLGGTMSEATVPLKAEGFLLGVLDVQAGSRDAFGEDDIRVLRGVADQLAMSIRNAQQVSDRAAQLEATSPLYRANRRLSGAATVEEVVQVVVDSVNETEADGCMVGVLERSSEGQLDRLRYLGSWRQRAGESCDQSASGDRQRVPAPGAVIPLSESVFPDALMEQFWSVTDIARDDRLPSDVRAVFERIGARAVVNVPLGGNSHPVGHLLVLCRKSRSFSRSSMRLFELLEEQAALALVRARRLDEVQRRARREELASKAASRMHESLDLETVLNTAARDIGEALGLAALDVRLGPVPTSTDRRDPQRDNGNKPRSDNRRREEE